MIDDAGPHSSGLLKAIDAELQRQKRTIRAGSNLIGPIESDGTCSIDGFVNMLALADIILRNASTDRASLGGTQLPRNEHEAGYRAGLEMAIRVGKRVAAKEMNEYSTGARFVVEAVEAVLEAAA